MVEERKVRHCNWLRFLKSSDNVDEVNMVAVKVEGQLLFQTVRPFRPNDEIVVYFDEPSKKPQHYPEDVSQTAHAEPENVSQTGEEVPEVVMKAISAGPETVPQTDREEMDVDMHPSDIEQEQPLQSGR
jgi:hypothetical protein